MNKPKNVAVLVGSLRKESYNRKLAKALVELAPPLLELEILEIGHLPFYNEDNEPTPPASWVEFRQRVAKADALVFVTPEYNRSTPPALKNAIDIGSRPYGSNVWSRKPATIISSAMGAMGGFGANHHLRQTLGCLNVRLLQQPEAYLGDMGDSLFDAEGGIVNERTRNFLNTHIQAYADWVQRILPNET